MLGAMVNLAFFWSIEWLKTFGLGYSGDLVAVAHRLEDWQRLITPALGGLLAGGILYWGLKLAGPQGPTNILEVVVAGDGRLRLRGALVKTLSSMVSIGTGASIGREGSITQLTATLSSKWGQLSDWQPYRLRLLVACGAASGLAAAYNAPVSGAVFAALIVLGNFSMNLFGPLVFASVISTMVTRFFGIGPWYVVPELEFHQITELPWFLLLGLLSGGAGALFLKMLRFSEDAFARLNWPIYIRMGLAGLMVGALAIKVPEVWGNGFSVTNEILHENYGVLFLLGLFLAKLVATVVTVGSGTVGGVFTPTLFIGAAVGSLFGSLVHWAGWGTSLQVGAFALVGMGSVLSATIHSPLLALIMIFEISLNYSLIPPVMLACAISTLVARRLHADSIYTEPLRKKGFELERESQQIGAATLRTVGELMREPVPPLRETASFREIVDRFLTSPNNFLPVVDAQQRLLGIVALHDLKEYLTMGFEFSGVIAYDVMRPPPACLTPNQKLLDVLPILLASELRNIPVVSSLTEFRLVGALVRSEALGLLSEAISTRTPMAS